MTRRSYVDSEGKNVYITEVVVDNLKTYGSTRNSAAATTTPTATAPTSTSDNNTSDTITIIDEVINNSTNQTEAPAHTDDNASEDEKAFD